MLLNLAPDEPFGGGEPGVDFDPSDPATTGQVMQFRVVAAKSVDLSIPPNQLGSLPGSAPLPGATRTRQASINELESSTVLVGEHMAHGHRRRQRRNVVTLSCRSREAVPFGPTQALLGRLTQGGEGNPLHWMDDVTENPEPGAVEIWEFHNFTVDAHPLHIHLVQFEILERIDGNGVSRGPEPWEKGPKDTMISYPGEVIRVKARFDIGRASTCGTATFSSTRTTR